MSLGRVAYRELLFLAKEFDRHAPLKGLISSTMLRRVDGTSDPSQTQNRAPHLDAYNRGLLEYLQHRLMYIPSSSRLSVSDVIRQKARVCSEDDASNTVDTALVAVRELSDRLAYAKELGLFDDNEDDIRRAISDHTGDSTSETGKKESLDVDDKRRQELVERVQLTDELRSGIFLLAHPLVEGTFSRSVVALIRHSASGAPSASSPSHTKGYIVNKPLKEPLTRTYTMSDHSRRVFGSNNLRFGGPVYIQDAEVLHSTPEFGGSKVLSGNFETKEEDQLFSYANLEAASTLVDQGKAQASDLMFFKGTSLWSLGQLEREIRHGWWIPVQAPLSLAVNPPEKLWKELMFALGGEYRALARIPEILTKKSTSPGTSAGL